MCLHLLGWGAEGPRAGARARELVGGATLVGGGAALVVWVVLWVWAAMVVGAALCYFTAGHSVLNVSGAEKGH